MAPPLSAEEKKSDKADAINLIPAFHRVFLLLPQTAHIRFRSRKRVHTRLSEKDRTQRLTRRNRGRFGWGWYHYSRSVPHVHQHPRAGYQNGKFCRFWGLVGGAPKKRRKPSEQRCAYACRCSEASRPRWAALSCRYCVNDKKYDQSVGRFTTLLIRRNRWLPIFQPHLVDFWRAFW